MKTKYYDLKRNYGDYDLFVINRGGRKNIFIEILKKDLIKINKRFQIFNKYEKREIKDGIYKINTFFKVNLFINLNFNEFKRKNCNIWILDIKY